MPIKFQPLFLRISTIPLMVQKGILRPQTISKNDEMYGQLLTDKLKKEHFEITRDLTIKRKLVIIQCHNMASM